MRSTVSFNDSDDMAIHKAVARWRISLPHGAPNEVDRAVISALLSFGATVGHDSAVCASLTLLHRVSQLIRRLAKACDRAHDKAKVQATGGYLAEAVKALRSIEPIGDVEPAAKTPEASPGERSGAGMKSKPIAEVQAGWSDHERQLREQVSHGKGR